METAEGAVPTLARVSRVTLIVKELRPPDTMASETRLICVDHPDRSIDVGRG
jgi:hypothetical protein